MSRSPRHRLSALIAGVAVVGALLVPTAPAFAEDPAPDPAITAPVETPAPDPEPSATPTPDPTAAPDPIPTPTSAPEPSATPTPPPTPTESATPTPTPTAAAVTEVTYTGVLSEFAADGQAGYDPDIQVLSVGASGLLLVDVAGVDLSDFASGSARVTMAVPEGLVLSSDPVERFEQLSSATAEAPLVATNATPAKQVGVTGGTSALVNQTSNTAATHEVYAVLVTPSNGAQDLVNQQASSVQGAINDTDAYWSAQSGGTVGFQLAGTTSWYRSANACTTIAGSTALWNEAIDVARTQLGYTPGKNIHLVLFFPASIDCGGAIGLGTVGSGVNQGGLAWVIGSSSATARQSTAHELGHNMSLGHASWADCNTADPHPGYLGTTGCAIRNYGDLVDVMGYGTLSRTGGALSSAQAIRASIWPESAWVRAEMGTYSYTIDSVTSHAGTRAVVVQDTDGVNYFVEFRNFTAEDAQYSGYGCTPYACVANTSGVRILRIENSGWQGVWGDDSYLIGRIVGGVKRVNYLVGESFTTPNLSTNTGLTITVTGMTATTATVSITRPNQGATAPGLGADAYSVDIAQTAGDDSLVRVGDTWSAFLGNGWTADDYDITWWRNDQPGPDVVIGTGPNYTLQPSDRGHFIRASVTGTSGSSSSTAGTDFYGPVQPPLYGPTDPGTVSVSNTTSMLAAVMPGWPVGTAFACKWVRETTAPFMAPVAGATNCASYPLTVADRDKDIAVQVTAVVPYGGGGNYGPVMRQSPARDYSITYATPGSVMLGTPQVGVPLSVTNTNTYKTADGPITPTLIYTWFRNGVAIVGASGPSFTTYTPVAGDYNNRLSVRVDASATGYVSLTGTTSALSALVLKADIPFTAAPTVSLAGPQLQASPASASTSEPGVTGAYQWVRVNPVTLAQTLIPGATGQNYTQVAADYGQLIKVRLTISKPGYNNRVLDSTPQGYSVIASPPVPTLVGEQRIGIDVTVAARTYTVDGAAMTPTLSYAWFRDGVAIPGTAGAGDTFSHYTPTTADAGKAITVTVTAASPALLSSVSTSSPTQKLTAFSLDGWDAALPPVVQTPGTLKLTLPSTGVTEPTATTAFQWLRDGVTIPGATGASYTMTAADTLKLISVRATSSAPLYTSVVKFSPGIDYSIRNTDPVSIPLITSASALWQVGAVGQVDGLAFATRDGPLPLPIYTYQWLRNGVAIPAPLGTTSTYALVAADLGAAVSVRVTASKPGYLPITVTTAAKPAVIKGDLAGSFAIPIVNVSAGNLLSAALPAGSITTPGVTYSYIWYVNGVTIQSRAATYQLTAADRPRTLSVQLTVTKPGYTDRILGRTTPLNYAITASGLADVVNLTRLDGNNPRVGDELLAGLPTYLTKDGGLTFPSGVATYQWFRRVGSGSAVAIPGATGARYVVQSADQPAAGFIGPMPPWPLTTTGNIYFTVTVSAPGFIPITQTSLQWGPVETGTITGTGDAPTVVASSTGVLSAVITPGSIDMPSPTFGYRWMQGAGGPGTGTLLATTPTYQLTTANATQTIWLELTATKAKAISSPSPWTFAPSTPTNYGITVTGGTTEVVVPSPPAPRVGDGLAAQAPSSFTANGSPVAPTFSYQWARRTPTGTFVNIAGPLGTGSSYVVLPVDLGYQLKVAVTARAPGFAPTLLESAPSQTTVLGEILTNGGPAALTLTNPMTNDYTVSVPPGTIQTPSTTLTYKWYRSGAPNVVIGTAPTYRLTALDAGQLIWAETIASRTGFAPKSIYSPAVDYGLHANGSFEITDEDGGAVETGDFLRAGDGLAYLDSSNLMVAWTVTYLWFRTGIATPIGTGPRYELTTADKDKTVYAVGTVTAPGRVPLKLTAPTTSIIGTGPLEGSFVGAVVIPNSNGSLKVSLPSGFLNTTGVTTTYQWFRTSTDGLTRTLIPGATGATYTLNTTTDVTASLIDVNLTFSKANLTVPAGVTMPITAAGRDPRINADVPQALGVVRVGETLSADTGAFTDANFVSAATSVQWLRTIGTTEVVVGTGLTYVIPAADFVTGSATKYRIRVTPTAPGSIGLPVLSDYTGQLVKGQFVINAVPPMVMLNPTMMTLTGSLTSGTTATPSPVVSYKWFREGVVTPIATTQTYKLQAADFQKNIWLVVEVSRPNFDPAAPIPASNATDYSIYMPDPPTIDGALRVGAPLTVTVGNTSDRLGSVLSSTPTFTYTWYRQVGSGAKVVIGSGPTYSPVVADVGATTRISVRVTVAAVGYLGLFKDSSGSLVTQGVFQGSKSSPVVTMNATTNTLTATIPAGAITDPSPTYSYQWLRNGSPISGATAASYKLVSATDWNVPIQVRVMVTKPGFASEQLGPSTAEYYSIYSNVAPAIEGAMQAGTVAEMNSVVWELRGSTISPVIKYEWLRKTGSAAPVVVATTPTYVLQAMDAAAGTTISLRITPTHPGGVFGTPAPAAASFTTLPRTITGGVFTGSFVAATVTENKPTMTLSASLTPGSVDQTGLTLAYQWFRQVGAGPTVAIAGATAATYKLVEADRGPTNVWVRITFSKPGFLPASPLFSNPATYTLGASQTIQVSPVSPSVGSILQVSAAGYDYTPSSVTYQWYRKTGSAAGVPIIGTLGTNPTYTVTAADTGSSIYAVVTGAYPGYFSNVQTTAPVAVPGVPWAGSLAVPVVTMTNVATLTVTATLPAGAITSTPFTGTWQWYRDTTPITGATTMTYKVVPADAGHDVFARYTATKPLYDPLLLDSAGVNYSMRHDATGDWLRFFPNNDQQLRVGLPAEGGWGDVLNASGAPVGTNVTFQWVRGTGSSTTVVGTGMTYTPTAADVGFFLTEKVTYTQAGYLPYTFSITSMSPVVNGDFVAFSLGDWLGMTWGTNMNATAPPPGELYQWYPTIKFTGTAGFTYQYQWLRDGNPMFGATGTSYQMTAAADQGHLINVRLTIKRAGYNDLVIFGNEADVSITFDTEPAISDVTPNVNDLLTVDPGTCYSGGATFVCDVSSSTKTYQWFIGTTPVPAVEGGTASTFVVPGTAVGQTISVRVHYPVDSHFTSPRTSAATDPVS